MFQSLFLKSMNAQYLQNPVQVFGDVEFFFHNGDEQVSADRGPDLDFHRVFTGSEKGPDAQVLLDPLEEKLDFPAFFVDEGDGQGRQMEMIRDENKEALIFADSDLTQRAGRARLKCVTSILANTSHYQAGSEVTNRFLAGQQ